MREARSPEAVHTHTDSLENKKIYKIKDSSIMPTEVG